MSNLNKKLLIFLSLCLLTSCNSKKANEVIEIWSTENSKFEVRVTSFREQDIFPSLAGASYVFESRALQEDKWTRIMVFNHDNAIPINKNNVVFVNENVCYVFMEWKYAVTINGGKSWEVWDGSEEFLAKSDLRYGLIQNVHLESNGEGTMILRSNIKPRILYTKDYGNNWTVAAN
jgi:hypothetical protein